MPKSIIVIGAARSGKTAFVRRIQGKKEFLNVYSETIGLDIVCEGGVTFWDTGGSNRFQNTIKKYMNRADVIVCCVDLAAEEWESTKKAFPTTPLAHALSACSKQRIPMILVATKMDQLSMNDISKNMNTLKQVFTSYKFLSCHMCSARTGHGFEGIHKVLCRAERESLLPPPPSSRQDRTWRSILCCLGQYTKLGDSEERPHSGLATL